MRSNKVKLHLTLIGKTKKKRLEREFRRKRRLKRKSDYKRKIVRELSNFRQAWMLFKRKRWNGRMRKLRKRSSQTS